MGKVVLCIDTAPESLQETLDLLRREGVDGLGATDFQQVHEAVESRSPQVVVIEPVLEGIDGFELCRAIRNVYRGYRPAVVLASRRIRGQVHAAKAREYGAQLFVERPEMDRQLVDYVVGALIRAPEPDTLAPTEPAEQRSRTVRTGRFGPRMFAGIAAVVGLIGAAWLFAARDRPATTSSTPSPANTARPAIAATDGDRPADPSPPQVVPAPVRDPKPASVVRSAAPQGDPAPAAAPAAARTEKATRPHSAFAQAFSLAVSEWTSAEAQPALEQTEGEFVEARLISFRAPVVPTSAEDAGVGGTVLLRGTVLLDGSLEAIEIVDDPAPDHRLGPAAVSAVRMWRYQPAMRDGATVESTITIPVEFPARKAPPRGARN